MAKALKHIKRRENPVREVAQRATSAHHRLGSSPLILFFLGALVLTLWLSSTIVQIQTSEYLALGAGNQVHGVSWFVLAQPWLLITGQVTNTADGTAWDYGWIIESLTLVFALALAVSYKKIESMNSLLAKAFIVSGFILIALNSWADYQSAPGTSSLIRFLVALAIGIMVTVGLPLGIGLIETGVSEFRG